MYQRTSSGRIVLRAGAIDGVKVFTATMARDRAQLGDVVTEWIARNPEVVVCEIVVLQSSDERYHCLTFAIFYRSTAETA